MSLLALAALRDAAMYYVYCPEDGELTPFYCRAEAEAFARECAEDGESVELLNVMRTFEAQPVDMCAFNGVTPGIDCPAFV